LRELGEVCCINRVPRLKRHKSAFVDWLPSLATPLSGLVSVHAPNHLQRQFAPTELNRVRIADITYLRRHESWLYFAVVLDLFSRQAIGWSMGSRIACELALNALLMSVWWHQPKQALMVHSDQGSQFSSYDWQCFLKAHKLQQSMSRCGNCHDDAVAGRLFQLLKREQICRKAYEIREDAKHHVFDCIAMLYNPKRWHSFSKLLLPMNYKK
jgi:putative transposase